jgi:hypothetical protein
VPLECPPGIGVFVADGVGVQLQVSSGEDGGSLGVGGDEVSDSVDVGCSLGVGSPVSDAVGVGDGSLVEGAGSELEGGRWMTRRRRLGGCRLGRRRVVPLSKVASTTLGRPLR